MDIERADLPDCYRSTGAEATRSKSGTLVVTLGSGSRGAVFAPISWEDACQWRSEAKWLASQGFVVASLSWGSNRAQSMRDAVDRVRALGATSVVLVGACVGGTAALDRASELSDVVRGVVAVSPLVAVAGIAVGADFATYSGPVLLLGTRNDPLTPPKALGDIDRMRKLRSEVLILNGSQHGVEIFSDPTHGPLARDKLQSFLNRALPPP